MRHLVFLFAVLSVFVLPATAQELQSRYTTATLKVRATPSATGEVKATVGKGVRVAIVGCKDGWCESRYGDRVGYLSEKYLSAAPPAGAVNSRTDLTPYVEQLDAISAKLLPASRDLSALSYRLMQEGAVPDDRMADDMGNMAYVYYLASRHLITVLSLYVETPQRPEHMQVVTRMINELPNTVDLANRVSDTVSASRNPLIREWGERLYGTIVEMNEAITGLRVIFSDAPLQDVTPQAANQ